MAVTAPGPNDPITTTWINAVTTGVNLRPPLAAVRLMNTSGAIGTTSGTTEMDMASYAISGFTLTTGRYYEARYAWTWTKTVGSDTFDVRLRANTAVTGIQISQVGFNYTDGLTGGYREFGLVFVGDASYTSLHLSVIRTAGTGTLSYYGALSGSPVMTRAWGQLDDRGDSTVWVDVP